MEVSKRVNFSVVAVSLLYSLLPASVAFWMRRWDCRGAAPPEATSLLTNFSQTSSGPFTVGSTPILATVFVLLEIHMSYTYTHFPQNITCM